MRVLHVVGARPNFMKIAPIMAAMSRHEGITQLLVHTGQHYDANMSQVFFDELGLPAPDVYLAVGSGSHAVQTANIMLKFEPVLHDFRPDWVVVPGDVNSTVACALVATKLGIKVAHLEAGLRSFDRTMPEEVNRVLTDHIADLLFTSEPSGNENLEHEGIAGSKVRYVGNVMIDTLVRLLPHAQGRWPALQSTLSLCKPYLLATLHRPSNVDDPSTLAEILAAFADLASALPIVFPVHPRTRARIAESGLTIAPAVRLLEPLGYLDFLALQAHAALVLTDSGGVQEETTYLGVRCLTARPNTERPVTITHGTNRLVESTRAALVAATHEVLGAPMAKYDASEVEALAGNAPVSPAKASTSDGERWFATGGSADSTHARTRDWQPPYLWDGRTAERVAEAFVELDRVAAQQGAPFHGS